MDRIQSRPSARPRGRIAPAWTERTGLLAPARFKGAFVSGAERDELITGGAPQSEAKRGETTMRKWALSSALLLLFLLTTLPDPGMTPRAGDLQFFTFPLIFVCVCVWFVDPGVLEAIGGGFRVARSLISSARRLILVSRSVSCPVCLNMSTLCDGSRGKFPTGRTRS